MVWDTVDVDTPALLATSSMVTTALFLLNGSLFTRPTAVRTDVVAGDQFWREQGNRFGRGFADLGRLGGLAALGERDKRSVEFRE